MMKRKTTNQPSQWVEVHRVERGMYLSPGYGWRTHTYACIVYEVTERRGDTYRTRVEDGAPLYERDFHVAGAWFKVLRAAMNEVSRECKRLDEKAAKRRAKR